MFLSIGKKEPEVVISKDGINSHTVLNCPERIVKNAAKLLRSDTLEYALNTPQLKWPPYIEDLHAIQQPQSLTIFFFHGVTRGKTITAKHFLLGLGLHNLTGQEKPVQIVNRLGHCIEYSMACEIETSHAEACQKQYAESAVLPIKPIDGNHTVKTFLG